MVTLFSLSKQNLQTNNTKRVKERTLKKATKIRAKQPRPKPQLRQKKNPKPLCGAGFIKVWMEWSTESNWAANCSVSEPIDEQFVCRVYTNNVWQMFKIYLTVTNSSTERYGYTIYSYRYYDIKRGIAVECLRKGLLILFTFVLPISKFLQVTSKTGQNFYF